LGWVPGGTTGTGTQIPTAPISHRNTMAGKWLQWKLVGQEFRLDLQPLEWLWLYCTENGLIVLFNSIKKFNFDNFIINIKVIS